MGRIIFLDVDGTLVNYENKLPPSAPKAIRAARANGHRVYLCTGRSEAEIYDEIRNIGFDGIIGGNGSYVRDGQDVILWRHITEAQCRQIVDWLHSRGLEFYLEANSGLYASENFEHAALNAVREYMGRKGHETSNITVRSVFPDMIFGAEPCRDDINKISFVLSSYQDYLDAADAFPELKTGTWGGAGETALFGDFSARNTGKGFAVDVLLKHLGASINDTFAFGDAKPDIPMLEKCAVGVAVGSGGDEIKAVAGYVTDTVDNDGLYKAFKHFGLIN